MGAASSVQLGPEEKALVTKQMEKLYADLQRTANGSLSEVEIYNTLSQYVEACHFVVAIV
jgi:hypothetical protein